MSATETYTEDDSRVVTLFQGKFLLFQRDGRWEYVSRVNSQGAVFVLALTPANEIVLVEQYRIAVQRSCVELPAGIIDSFADGRREKPEETAVRELLEETGYLGRPPEPLLYGPSSPGLASEMMHLYLVREARRVGQGGGVPQEDEAITVHVVPLADVRSFLQQTQAAGKYVEPRIYAGLWFAERMVLPGRRRCR